MGMENHFYTREVKKDSENGKGIKELQLPKII